jgi:serine protease
LPPSQPIHLQARRTAAHIIITATVNLSPLQRRRPRVPVLAAAVCLTLAAGLALRAPAKAAASSFAPDRVVVGFASPEHASAASVAAAAASAGAESEHTAVLRLHRGESVQQALQRLRRRSDVAWAVPDYRAHTAGTFVPDDIGGGTAAGGWQEWQWNLAGPYGIGAPEAWANLIATGHAGGRGVTVAVLDTGVAYANRGRFRRSPDFGRFQFVGGYDFVGHDPYPNDRNGHGTFVAGTIAEDTNNRYGLTGIAYGAKIMPVRVLDTEGEGEASTIAQGVRFAVRHGAQVINLSLEFSPGVTASDIPELISALRYAHRRRVLVVAAAGNEGHAAIAYPARAPDVISVGATTDHGCLAAYSNDGSGLTLVAPGGGPDADLPGDPNCNPESPGRDIFQVTFSGGSVKRFGIPGGYEGTSMATPHVSAVAALVIASGVLGRRPTPAQLTARLRATARKLGAGGDERLYGAGLLDAAAATAPATPGTKAG